MASGSYISNFIKYNRNKLKMTQPALAQKAGVGLRFIRELEQGKETLRMDKVNQVLALFGYQVIAASVRIKDPYDIMMNHFNKSVHIYLKDKTDFAGFIVDAISEGNEIKAWKFVPNNNAQKYQQTKNEKLVRVINNSAIEEIANIEHAEIENI